VVDAEQYDPAQAKYSPAGDDFRRALSNRGPIGSHLTVQSANDGFASLGGNLYAWGAAPVVHSNAQGPAVGYIVLVSQLDEAFLRSATETVAAQLALLTHPISAGGIHPVHTPLEYTDAQIVFHDETSLEMRFNVGTLDDGNALDVSVSIPRLAHATAIRSSRLLLWSTLAFGTLLCALALWFVERRLLRPIQVARNGLLQIGWSGNLSGRLSPVSHNDQLGELIQATNKMLDQMQERDVRLAMQRQEIENAAARNGAILEAIPDPLFELDSDGRCINYHSPQRNLAR